MGVIIMGGEYRGRKLATDTRSGVIRPTSGKVREALFSSLGGRVPGSAFVDLYAGSGAVGLEALSRGAREVHQVENHPQSFALLKANCQTVIGGKPDAAAARAVRAEAGAFCRDMAAQGRRFDLVFADPPFDRGGDFAALPALFRGLLAEDGTAIIQFPFRAPPEWLPQAGKVRRYGESGLAFFDFQGLPA
jgi:16S rRNA (guanine(966)-N(2))-methyltransferase RsmD